MIVITIFIVGAISLIFAIINLIAHCIVAAIQGIFEGLTYKIKDSINKK